MQKEMRKIIAPLFSIIFISVMPFVPKYTAVAQEKDDGTELYILYDNSDSMHLNNNTAWCKAAYAIETLVAMMDAKDSITIYFMKDESPYFEKKEIIRRPDNGEALQNEIYETLESLVYTKSTYIDGLHQAIQDIKQSNGKDKQLLILSDGQFNKEGSSKEITDVDLGRELPGIPKIYFKMNQDGKSQEGKVINYVIGDMVFFQGNGNNMLQKFIEVGNYIYDRQTIDVIKSNNHISVTLELPAKRLIVLAQSQENSISHEQIEENLGKLTETSRVSYQSLGSHNEKKTDFNYYAGVKIYTAESLISSGTYDITVPQNTEVTVFTEYEVQYALFLEDENGQEWDISKSQTKEKIREGSYILKIKLIDSLKKQPLIGTVLQDKLRSELFLDSQKLGEKDYNSLYLSEGKHNIRGWVELEGNAPIETDFTLEIGHRLGNVEIYIETPDRGFNVDLIGKQREMLFVSVLEDGKNISETQGLELKSIGAEKGCEYFIKKTVGGWNIYPELSRERIGKTEFQSGTKLTLQATGVIDGEPIDVQNECLISYYALPQNIVFEDISIDIRDALAFLINNKVQFTPLIDGKPIKDEELIENMEIVVTAETLPAGIEGIKGKLTKNSGEWQVEMTFKGGKKIWLFTRGYTVTGNVGITLDRYGAECSGNTAFTITVGNFSAESWLILITAMLIIFYLLWNIIRMFIIKNTFWLISISVECKTFYGKKTSTIKIPIEKRIWKNIIHQLHPRIAIPLGKVQYLGFSNYIPNEMLIRRRWGSGKCIIINIKDFIDCGYVLAKSSRRLTILDNEFDLIEGLEWTLLGKRNTQIRIGLKGSDWE